MDGGSWPRQSSGVTRCPSLTDLLATVGYHYATETVRHLLSRKVEHIAAAERLFATDRLNRVWYIKVDAFETEVVEFEPTERGLFSVLACRWVDAVSAETNPDWFVSFGAEDDARCRLSVSPSLFRQIKPCVRYT